MPISLEGSPTSAANQLIAHLRNTPGLEGLFPEPDPVTPLAPAKSDQEHLLWIIRIQLPSFPEQVAQTDAEQACMNQSRGGISSTSFSRVWYHT